MSYTVVASNGSELHMTPDDLRAFQDAISIILVLDEGWKGFESEEGVRVSVIREESRYWDERNKDEAEAWLLGGKGAGQVQLPPAMR
jgi:hypothetical protein